MTMQRPSLAQILRDLSNESQTALPRLEIAVLRNVVVEPIEPYLRHLARQMGFDARCQFGEYDRVFQEAIGGSDGLLNQETDCALVFLKLENLSWDLARDFPSLKPAQLAAEKERAQDFILAVLEGIRKQTAAMILWLGFEAPVYPALGIVDGQRDDGQTGVIDELNRSLREALRQRKNAYFVDLNLCLARIGAKNFYDQRYWHIGKAPYSREALQEIAGEVFKYIRALKGRNKKCLALDCDNVLWGGTIGEDGLAGIKLGRTYPGSAYYEFQQEILNLHRRGVVLALCSKNNEEDVWEVFERHPDMRLRREHIAAARINWRDKATNLREIAADLNLGLDSLVFVDDSDFEVNLIRSLLPEVEVIELPKGGAVAYREALAACGYFDTLALSQEDAERGAMYQAEVARKQFQLQHQNLESYLASLEMALEIRMADEFSIPRIAQLTQKTNQFNLTTRRYSDADIQRLMESEAAEVLYLRLRDRFGDSGIVGVCILRYEAGQAIFDSFLLSCRVLGRGVEDAFLTQCLKRAGLKQCRAAVGEYYSTAKNDQVKDFYLRQGFEPSAGENGARRFLIDLTALARHEPRHFRRIDSDFDDAVRIA
ncbi:MAG: HAD-IIIC family phosphatase [Blastocatellia bacterium]